MVEEHTFDIGNTVRCDFCGDDYTDSDAVGGILFGSKAVCPDCAARLMPDIVKYNEGHFIRDTAREGETFAAFCLRLRDGDNTVLIRDDNPEFVAHVKAYLGVKE